MLLVGWAIPRITASDNGTTTTVTGPPATADVTLACPLSLRPTCNSLGQEVGAAVRTWTAGDTISEDEVLVAPTGDLPEGLTSSGELGRSPVAVAVWLERANVLASGCGGNADLACVEKALGQQWSDLGGSDSWGIFKLGLADPTLTEPGLAAWSALAGDETPEGLAESLRLVASDDGRLMADMVLFGPSRADAAVTTEVAIASQLANAPGRGGRLVVTYPDPAPWVSYVVAPGGGSDARRTAERLLEPDIASLLGPAGLRPPGGEPGELPEGLGQPGVQSPPLDDATSQGLLDSWRDLTQ